MRYVKQDPREPDSEPYYGDRDAEGCLIYSYHELDVARAMQAQYLIAKMDQSLPGVKEFNRLSRLCSEAIG